MNAWKQNNFDCLTFFESLFFNGKNKMEAIFYLANFTSPARLFFNVGTPAVVAWR